MTTKGLATLNQLQSDKQKPALLAVSRVINIKECLFNRLRGLIAGDELNVIVTIWVPKYDVNTRKEEGMTLIRVYCD